MEIKKDYKLNTLIEIFNENNQGFVYDKNSITSPEFIRYVCTKNDEAVGYLVLYPKNDFVSKESFDINVSIPKNSIYIWHIITKKGCERKGVAKTLINYIKREFGNFNIYSIIDDNNIKSKRLHESLGFLPVVKFKKRYKDTLDNYTLVKFNAKLS